MPFPPHTAQMLPIASAFASGIAAAMFLHSYVFALLIIGLGVISLIYRRIYWVLMVLCVLAGGLDYMVNRPMDSVAVDTPSRFIGTVDRVKDMTSSRAVTVRISNIDGLEIDPFSANLIIPSAEPALSVGDRLAFGASLKPLSYIPDLPDEFDVTSKMRSQGIIRSGVVVSDSITAIWTDPSLYYSIRRFQSTLRDIIRGSALDDNSKDFLMTCLLGDPDAMSQDRRDNYTSSGMAHILALSGLHVAVLTLIITLLLIPLRLCRIRWISPVSVIILLWIFALVTGLSASVVRAVIMATVISFGILLQRRSTTANSLALAAFLILLFDPAQLISVGFQLSFAAVAGIIAFGPHFVFWEKRSAPLRFFGAFVATSLSAILGSTVFSAYYFNAIPLLFLPANCIILPFILPVVLFIGIIVIITGVCGIEIIWICRVEDFLVRLIDKITALVANTPWSAISLGDVGIVGAVFAIGALVVFKIWLVKRRYIWMVACVTMAILSITACVERMMPDRGFEIYFVQKHPRSSEIYVRSDTSLYLISTSVPGERDGIKDAAMRRYGRYMRRRGISNITIASDTCDLGPVARRGNWVAAGNHAILLAVHNNLPFLPENKRIRVDYVVVAPTFRGRMSDILNYVRPDSVVCSSLWLDRQIPKQ